MGHWHSDCCLLPDFHQSLRDSSVGIATSYGLDDREVGVRISVFSTSSRPALESTQPPIQWVPGALSPGVKRPVRVADHLPPTSAEVKKTCVYTSTPPYAFMSYKHKENFTFTLPSRSSTANKNITASFRILSHLLFTFIQMFDTVDWRELLKVLLSRLRAGIASGYGLDGREIGSPLQVVQTSSGAHSASYPMGTAGKSAEKWSWRSRITGSLYPLLNMFSWRSAQLINHRGQIYTWFKWILSSILFWNLNYFNFFFFLQNNHFYPTLRTTPQYVFMAQCSIN
jgi:hypothetical protein